MQTEMAQTSQCIYSLIRGQNFVWILIFAGRGDQVQFVPYELKFVRNKNGLSILVCREQDGLNTLGPRRWGSLKKSTSVNILLSDWRHVQTGISVCCLHVKHVFVWQCSNCNTHFIYKKSPTTTSPLEWSRGKLQPSICQTEVLNKQCRPRSD